MMNDTTTYFDQSAVASNATVGDYFSLLKPRVMLLVVFTAVIGLVLAPGTLHPVLACVAILCVAVGAGASGAINMWYDYDIDCIMKRTKTRPLPMGKIAPADALAFGVVLTLFSVMLMGTAVSWVAAGLLAFASFFYIFIYTIALKRRTPQNIVIGGAAGAFPPMIGWAAVTGDVSIESITLFAMIFMWTPPHFWALALFRNADYKLAKIPMLPVTHGARVTKIQMFIYTLLLLPLCTMPYVLGISGIGYLIGSLVLNALFIISAFRVLKSTTDKPAKQMFGYSIFYLFALFGLLLV